MAALCKRAQTRFVVLPPSSGVAASRVFRNVEQDTLGHNRLVSEMQRFRGSMYLRDGAIQRSDLTVDGRHKVEVDDRSWHVLSLDRNHRVCACLRFVDETRAAGFDDLWIRRAALADSPELAGRFREAVEERMRDARRMGMSFGEVGGWAVAEEHRHTLEPVRIILATYALLELLGGSLGVATATYRHESAPMLRRIGLGGMLSSGEELPSYYDPHYGCHMQVLQFDSRHPNPKYRGWVAELETDLTSARVVCRQTPQAREIPKSQDRLQGRLLRGFELAPPVPA
jgi:hypothetical protein